MKVAYTTFDSTNDLYVYFQEREIANLRFGGRMAMIVANKWMRAGYGMSLRGYLRRIAQPIEVVDFGHSPIFPDADTFPWILICGKRKQAISPNLEMPSKEQMGAATVPREDWNDKMNLKQYVDSRRYFLPTHLLQDHGEPRHYIEPFQLQDSSMSKRITTRSLSHSIWLFMVSGHSLHA